MRKSLVFVAAGALSLGLAGTVTAQSKGQGLAIVPFAAFNLPGELASESGNQKWKPKSGAFIGAQLELGVSKAVSVGVGGGVTMSQTLDLIAIGGSSTGADTAYSTADISTARIYGVVSIRPAGRRPNGAVTPLAIELGGGVTRWAFDTGARAGSGTADFNATKPFVFAGLAMNFPVGPRSSIQLFARALGTTAYSSKGLDDWNAAPPATNIKGKFNLGFLIGAGIRVGR